MPYDAMTWVCWILLAIAVAWWRGWRGIFFGQLAVAATVLMLNIRWVHAAMSRPGWKGTPSYDASFFAGLALHIIFINGLLFPANLAALFLRSQRKTLPRDSGPRTNSAQDSL